MTLLWSILRLAGRDIWYESFWLILFNIFWVVATLPGLFLINLAVVNGVYLLILPGIILLFPWPLATFGLFHVAYQIEEDTVISLKTFFQGCRQLQREAYIWGGINLFLIAILVINIQFYSNPSNPLGQSIMGVILSAFFAAIAFLWLMLQLFVLSLYSRFETPELWPILQKASLLLRIHPFLSAGIALLILGLLIVTWYLPVLGITLSFSTITIFANRTTTALLARQNAQS